MGVAVPQSAFDWQEEHVPCAGLQTGWLGGQSVFAAHATQAPVFGLQIGASFGHAVPAMQAGWQVLVPG